MELFIYQDPVCLKTGQEGKRHLVKIIDGSDIVVEVRCIKTNKKAYLDRRTLQVPTQQELEM